MRDTEGVTVTDDQRGVRPLSQIPPSRLANLRDLAGIAVGGGRVRADTIWRSDDVSLVTVDQADELVQAGLTAIIDLRAPEEAELTGRGVMGHFAVAYHHVPLLETVVLPEALTEMLRGGSPADVGRWYADLIETRTPSFVQALEVVASADGPVIFHCSAGKDRTGVLAAIVLALLGADDEDIIADYAKTAEFLPTIRLRVRPVAQALMPLRQGTRPPVRKDASDAVPAGMDAHPDSMRTMLNALPRERLSIVLAEGGMTPALLNQLRGRLVDQERW